jgi:hypothetical protein
VLSDARNLCASGLCPSSGILNIYKTQVWEIGSVFVLSCGVGDTYSVVSLGLRFALSTEPNRVGGLHPLNRRQKQIRLSKRYILYRMPSSRMLRRVALGRTDVSEERIASIIRMTRIGELGTLAVSGSQSKLRRNAISPS